MALPLFTRAVEDDGSFVVTTGVGPAERDVRARDDARRARSTTAALLPDRKPAAGEQFRFHINMAACIGCKCCVVACNEQNGNPSSINWRRVAEVESGTFPAARRAFVSMGCNHCADPTCLAGCPVDAYSKDEATGIVRHSADTCIGCQYCTWTCSYGVPQFNPERGVVGKCDMCHGRLELGQAPACVSACPEGAIGIEIVNVAEWRAQSAAARQPFGDGSLSTSRLTSPAGLSDQVRPVEPQVSEPEHAHAPLVLMTVLTQLAAGAFLAVAAALAAGAAAAGARTATLVAVGALGVGLAGSTLHLGRPIHAYRAMKMWRRSWLSREVVLFGAFAKAAGLTAGLVWFNWPGAAVAAVAAAVIGVAGVVASAFIYQVPSRPLWHSPRTFAQFVGSALLLGPMAAAAAGLPPVPVWRAITMAVGAVQLVFIALMWRSLQVSSSRELQGARRLLRTTLRPLAIARVLLLVVGAVLLPAAISGTAALGAALALATAGELIGRYLFFVAAVPRHMTAPYLADDREAA